VTDHTSSVGAVVCGLLALACTAPESLPSAPNAALVQTCAPWDGPAVALFLTDQPAVATYPSAPYAAIMVYRSISAVVGHHFDVSPESQNLGQAQICPAVGECQPANGASVSFRELRADSTVEVEYRLDLAPNRVMTGKGRARFYPTAALCG
jgi:hypothetical protein